MSIWYNEDGGLSEKFIEELDNFLRDEVAEVEIKDDKMTIKRTTNRCALCGIKENLNSFYHMKFICDNCINTIRKLG